MKIIILLVAILVAVALAKYTQQPAPPSQWRNSDGYGNNIQNPTWGSFGTAKLRRVNFYDDGISVPYGGQPSRLPNPRTISNLVFNRPIPHFLAKNTTNALTFFGQFIDHDIALTDIPDTTDPACDPFPIPVPAGDVIFDPLSKGTASLGFCKSVIVPGTGTSTSNPRQFPNQDTGYLDASNIYGSTNESALAIRAFKGGLFLSQPGPDGELLPFNIAPGGGVLVQGIGNEGPYPLTALYAGGEERVNENSVLTCYHTLWMREHNRRARSLPQEWTDEEIFQTARKWTTALYEHIVIYEYLPTILGENLPPYTGYDPTVMSQSDLYFTTCFFRFGHDQLPTEIDRLDRNGRVISEGNVILRDAFFNPALVTEHGISEIFRGIVSAKQFKMDAIVVDDVRDFLFHEGAGQAGDLVSRNIQRAREFGLGSYNDAREAYGLPRCPDYHCITSEPAALDALNAAYGPNGIDLVDPFVGALVERKRPNSLFVGDLLFAAFVDQFTRYRDGDRFWFETPGFFTDEELKEIYSTTFGDIIQRNTDSKNIPKHVFHKGQETAFEIFNRIGLPSSYYANPHGPSIETETVVNFFDEK